MNGSLYFYLFATHLFFLFQSSFSLTTLTLKYSGGQATEGQGGFYGSGGARAIENPAASSANHLSSLTTLTLKYSGGQATEGQGGFYGSGGARAIENPAASSATTTTSKLLALAADVEKVQNTMTELERLENLLLNEDSEEISGKVIELRQCIKKLMTSSDFLDSLGRLEVQGEPVWGLSGEEREMIVTAREKVNDC
eukprot:CAMPEP_0202473964 /NCGR_PEP_ID=MMETSP1360-20130828/92128_1 /ASSEMBLY_ACC=CAM_ASM_000848 /TAXON_ID=515479 /ORGANISM="Licmophora paradoxa, Strain CCMP2313" /LENGTH=196 /DNA_ID=CAMNT_0049101053 /DNA_START=362 /DNA_END=954 /DNA_ORIENTATION=-